MTSHEGLSELAAAAAEVLRTVNPKYPANLAALLTAVVDVSPKHRRQLLWVAELVFIGIVAEIDAAFDYVSQFFMRQANKDWEGEAIPTRLANTYKVRSKALQSVKTPIAITLLDMYGRPTTAVAAKTPVAQDCGMDVCVAVDASGSVEDPEYGGFPGAFPVEKELAISLMVSYKTPGTFHISTFTTEPFVIINSTDVGTEAARDAAIAAVRAASYSKGGTGIANALKACLSFVKSRARPSLVVLITDGGDSGDTEAAEVQEAARAIKDANATLSTVGVGTKANWELLGAAASSGFAFAAPSAHSAAGTAWFITASACSLPSGQLFQRALFGVEAATFDHVGTSSLPPAESLRWQNTVFLLSSLSSLSYALPTEYPSTKPAGQQHPISHTLHSLGLAAWEPVDVPVANAQAFMALTVDGDIVVAVRGTQEKVDFLTDFEAQHFKWPAGGIPAELEGLAECTLFEPNEICLHAGFLIYATALSHKVFPIMERFSRQAEQEHGNGSAINLWFTGHSLGGAGAYILSAMFREFFLNSAQSWAAAHPGLRIKGVVTFESPKGVNEVFNQLIWRDLKAVTARYVADPDFVTCLSPVLAAAEGYGLKLWRNESAAFEAGFAGYGPSTADDLASTDCINTKLFDAHATKWWYPIMTDITDNECQRARAAGAWPVGAGVPWCPNWAAIAKQVFRAIGFPLLVTGRVTPEFPDPSGVVVLCSYSRLMQGGAEAFLCRTNTWVDGSFACPNVERDLPDNPKDAYNFQCRALAPAAGGTFVLMKTAAVLEWDYTAKTTLDLGELVHELFNDDIFPSIKRGESVTVYPLKNDYFYPSSHVSVDYISGCMHGAAEFQTGNAVLYTADRGSGGCLGMLPETCEVHIKVDTREVVTYLTGDVMC